MSKKLYNSAVIFIIICTFISLLCGCNSNNHKLSENKQETVTTDNSILFEETTAKETTTEEPTSEDTSSDTNEKFIAQGNTTLMNFLNATSDYGFSITNPKKDDSYVTAVAKGENDSFNIRYMVEKQHVYMVEIIADNNDIILSDGFKQCVSAMAKSINPDIDENNLNSNIEKAISNADVGFVDGNTYFKYDSSNKTFTITYWYIFRELPIKQLP